MTISESAPQTQITNTTPINLHTQGVIAHRVGAQALLLLPRPSASVRQRAALRLEHARAQRRLLFQPHVSVNEEGQRKALRITHTPHIHLGLEDVQHPRHQVQVVAAGDVGLEAGVAAMRFGRDVDGVEAAHRQPVHRVTTRFKQVVVDQGVRVQRADPARSLRVTARPRAHGHALRRLGSIIEELFRHFGSHIVHHHVEETAVQPALAERRLRHGHGGTRNHEAVERLLPGDQLRALHGHVDPLQGRRQRAGEELLRRGAEPRVGEKKHVVAHRRT